MSIIKPVFDFGPENDNTVLHETKGKVHMEGNEYDADIEVRHELIPGANIYFYARVENMSDREGFLYTLGNSFGRPSDISLFIKDEFPKAFCVHRNYNAQEHVFTTKWCPKSLPIIGVGDDETSITSSVFHLFNYVNFISFVKNTDAKQGYPPSSLVVKNAKLIYDEWEITINPSDTSSETFNSLKEKGGYGLTHIGHIQKTTGEAYNGKDLHELYHALRFFISFSAGYWCTPVCPVGFNEPGKRVWELWSCPEQPWRTHSSWFDYWNATQIEVLFPLFMKCWKNSEWRKALREVIYWYLAANQNSRGIDTGIILAQAAIERLSFEYAVKDKRLITAKEFKDLRASDKYRLLFSSLNIPLDITEDTPDLFTLKNDSNINWDDAPHALTDIRNSLIHPDKNREKINDVFYDAWNLGLWYLEMGILAVCGYSGTYGNRLKERYPGTVDKVPWAEQKKRSEPSVPD